MSDEGFNFFKELEEFLKGKKVNSIELFDLEQGQSCKLTLVTLEDKTYFIDWDVINGMKINSVIGADGEPTKPTHPIYEDMNQLLQNESPGYAQTFQNDLFSKLKNLEAQQKDADNSSDY